jgi:hypothetical protein
MPIQVKNETNQALKARVSPNRHLLRHQVKKVVLQVVQRPLQRPPHLNHILLHQHINYQNDRIAHITHIQEKTNENNVDDPKQRKGDIKKREVREDITTIANHCSYLRLIVNLFLSNY